MHVSTGDSGLTYTVRCLRTVYVNADLLSVLFAASRVVHLGAVIAAVVLMFHPAANAYIRATTRAAARRQRRQDRDGGTAR
jgi:hypothetical protein